ncbi:hypothetical protein [Streptomyces sp. x-80]
MIHAYGRTTAVANCHRATDLGGDCTPWNKQGGKDGIAYGCIGSPA